MPYTKIWIHLIWSTKNREKIITKELRKVLLEHIIENAKLKGIFIKVINCVNDHVHLLISLGR
ncbi:MAG: transposase, partial [Ignavibacteriales bacterium]